MAFNNESLVIIYDAEVNALFQGNNMSRKWQLFICLRCLNQTRRVYMQCCIGLLNWNANVYFLWKQKCVVSDQLEKYLSILLRSTIDKHTIYMFSQLNETQNLHGVSNWNNKPTHAVLFAGSWRPYFVNPKSLCKYIALKFGSPSSSPGYLLIWTAIVCV